MPLSWLYDAPLPLPPERQELVAPAPLLVEAQDPGGFVTGERPSIAMFPATSSAAAAQYYLMIFLLALFVGPMMAPSSALDFVLRGWLVHWALPAMLCLLVALFDTSLELTKQTLEPATRATRAKNQRNLYLTLLNIVLTVAISRIYILLHGRKASGEAAASCELARATSENAFKRARAECERAHAGQKAAEMAQAAAEVERDRLSRLLMAALAQPPDVAATSAASAAASAAAAGPSVVAVDQSSSSPSRSELVTFWSPEYSTGQSEDSNSRGGGEEDEGVPPSSTRKIS